MKKFKCPECGNVSEVLVTQITGECTVTPNGDATLEYWEQGNSECEACGYQSGLYYPEFEIIEE